MTATGTREGDLIPVSREVYEAIQKLAEENRRWNVELFTPAGLKVLFEDQRRAEGTARQWWGD